MEKEKIFEILNDWNFWFKPLPKTFARRSYEQEFAQAQKELREELECIVISLDTSKQIEYDGVEIQVVNVLDFLLAK